MKPPNLVDPWVERKVYWGIKLPRLSIGGGWSGAERRAK